MTKRSLGDKVFDIINYSFLAVLTITTAYPFLYIAFASLSNPSLLISHEGLLFKPLGMQFETYALVFKNPMIIKGYMNTLFIVVVGTALNLLMTSLGAYILSRRQFAIKKAMMVMIVFTMLFSGGLIPFYLTVNMLGLRDSLWALIVPGLISTTNLIIMRTSFIGIPASLEESAKIDGANDFVILFRIILPLSKALIAVMILYYGVGHWNSWFNAMIFLGDRNKFPLQLILREILIQNDVNVMLTDMGGMDKEPVAENLKYATIMVTTLPVLAVYPFLQKYFVKGVMIGALKG